MKQNEEKSYKQILGEYVVEHFVEDGMRIGLGTGTTAIWAVREIARRRSKGMLQNICCGATGPGTELEAVQLQLPLYNLNSPRIRRFDITIDGADECDGAHNMIKGGGGCLLHEKVVTYRSDRFVCVLGSHKLVDNLGSTVSLPIEVIPCAMQSVTDMLSDIADVQKVHLRLDTRRVGPWITEEGNYILDVVFADSFDAFEREKEIVAQVGVVECGIFSVQRMRSKPVLCVFSEEHARELRHLTRHISVRY